MDDQVKILNWFLLFHAGDAIMDLVTVKRDIETRHLDVVWFKLAMRYM